MNSYISESNSFSYWVDHAVPIFLLVLTHREFIVSRSGQAFFHIAADSLFKVDSFTPN